MRTPSQSLVGAALAAALAGVFVGRLIAPGVAEVASAEDQVLRDGRELRGELEVR